MITFHLKIRVIWLAYEVENYSTIFSTLHFTVVSYTRCFVHLIYYVMIQKWQQNVWSYFKMGWTQNISLR